MMTTMLDRILRHWVNFHPFVRVLLSLIAAVVFLLFAVMPGFRLMKHWRLQSSMSSAETALADERMVEARDLSLTLVQAGDSRIEAYRILDKSMSALRDPRHAEIARALVSHPQGSDVDRLEGLRGMAHSVALGLLGQVWAMLPESCRKNPDFAVVFADRLVSEGRMVEASSVLLEVPREMRRGLIEPRLIRILIRSGKRGGFEEAQRRIASGWPQSADEFDAWLDLLEELPIIELKPDLLKTVASMLDHPGKGNSARCSLASARLDYASGINRKSAVINQSVTRWKDEAPEAVAAFMRDLDLDQQLLDTFPVTCVADRPGLFPYLLQAMERSGKWEQAALLLAAHRELLPPFEWHAHRAMAAEKTGDDAAFRDGWNSALTEAKFSGSSEAFLTLRRITRSAGFNAEADKAMLEGVLTGRGPLPLFADLKSLLGSLAAEGREDILLRILAIYMPFEPSNPVLLTQSCYLVVMNDMLPPQQTIEALNAMAAAFPDEHHIRFVLATAYLCDGQPAAADEVLDSIKVDLERVAPGYRAVFLAAQVGNDRLKRDDPLIMDFPLNSLLPSARRKFREWTRAKPPSVTLKD